MKITVTVNLDIEQTAHIENALTMYIDYLRDGNKYDKQLAEAVERTYDNFNKQLKWA